MEHNQKMSATIDKDGDKALERVRDVADTAWDKSRETWKDLSARGKEAMSGAQKSAEEAWEDARKLVQKHPAKVVGIALLVGTAIGALLAFRRKD